MKSFRRYYLDQCLNQCKYLIKGRVLDVGGKRIGRRGLFIPPVENIESWEYLNTDASTNPTFNCSADDIPLDANGINTVIMTELLEYLPNPKVVFSEIYRVLCKSGYALISVPFMNPIHGDSWADRARYTPVMLREIIEPVGFKIESIEPMGSIGAVIFDIIRAAFGYAGKNGERLILTKILVLFRPFFKWVDNLCSSHSIYINTGYFIILKKT